MTSYKLPEFDEITDTLGETELKLHASQVHGLISGVLCGNFNEQTDWQELVMGEKLVGEPAEMLQQVYVGTNHQLADLLLEFQLMLPEDSYDLATRAEALTVWCQGFLTGLKLAGVPVIGREDSELTESIDDLIEIAKMNYQEVADSEEDEDAYIELVEYVRMAVILIFTELHSNTDSSSPALSSHLH